MKRVKVLVNDNSIGFENMINNFIKDVETTASNNNCEFNIINLNTMCTKNCMLIATILYEVKDQTLISTDTKGDMI